MGPNGNYLRRRKRCRSDAARPIGRIDVKRIDFPCTAVIVAVVRRSEGGETKKGMTSQSQPSLRRASSADARAIAEVQVHTWRQAYAGVMPADFLQQLDVGRTRGRLG